MKLIFSFLFTCLSLYTVAQPSPAGSFQKKVSILTRFLEQNHYLPVVWNDSTSSLLYDKWMERLDEEKLIFMEQDIVDLEKYRTRLDDELKSRQPGEFFSRSIALYRAGLKRADSLFNSLLKKPMDLSKNEIITWPFISYAGSSGELGSRWQKFLRWKVLENIVDHLSDEGKKLTNKIPAEILVLEKEARERTSHMKYSFFGGLSTPVEQFRMDMEEDYLNSIAWCYDPHTSYMNIKEKKDFVTRMSASEFSSGFELEENEKGDMAIKFLQPGGSAWRSGQLHSGDVLVKVKSGGKEKAVAEIEDEDELDNMLSGNEESDIEVTVKTTAGELKTVKLRKEKIDSEEGIVKSYVLRGDKNIGYINLPGFYSREEENITELRDIKYDGSANDVSKEIVKLRKDSIAGLILDLRYKGGGSMWEAMQLSGIFIDIGPVSSVKEKDGKVSFLKDPNRGTIYDGPLIVLINGASASASEFVSAVLQDYNRAIIVGGTSYGKGTAQAILPLDTLGFSKEKEYLEFVKVTQRKFYRVNGSTTQWKGVVPDITLPDLYSNDNFKEKASRSALQPDNSRTGIYQPGMPLPVATLKTRSEERVKKDPYFTAIQAFNTWMKNNRSITSIPLDWGGYVLQHTKVMEIFKGMGSDPGFGNNAFRVTNNSFDNQRIKVSTQHSIEINDAYLKQVQKDVMLAEAGKIMLDWINK